MVLIDWLWWGETDVSEPRPSRAYCSSPVVNVSGEPWWWWWWWLGITPDLSTRACWQSYQQRHLEQVGRMNEWRNENFVYSVSLYLWHVTRSFTCRKILRLETSGCTSYLKEGVLRIFITLKNSLPRLGLNPRPLGPVASTLTTAL
jgi:hypothetical protein